MVYVLLLVIGVLTAFCVWLLFKLDEDITRQLDAIKGRLFQLSEQQENVNTKQGGRDR